MTMHSYYAQNTIAVVAIFTVLIGGLVIAINR